MLTIPSLNIPAAVLLTLLLMLISIGPLFYLAVLLLNDRLVRLPLGRRRRHAFLIGMVAPAALFLVNLIAAELCTRALFNAMG
jgi:hypothetical protein